MMMTNETRMLISSLYKKLGLEDEDLIRLTDILVAESTVLDTYKDSVCDIVNSYHNEKKALLVIIEELVIVCSATRDYESNRESYSKKQEELLMDTGAEVLVKAFKALGKAT